MKKRSVWGSGRVVSGLRRSALCAFALSVVTWGISAAPASADGSAGQDKVTIAEPPPEWSFQLTPYFWMAGINGQVGAFGAPAVDVDMSFGDIFEALNIAAMVAGEVRYGRFSLTTDVTYLRTTTDNATPRGLLANDVELRTRTMQATALAGLAMIDREGLRLDVVAGPRLWYVEDRLSFGGGSLDGRAFNDSGVWVDGMAGAKGHVDLTDNLRLVGMGLIGTGGSQFGWDALGVLSYRVDEGISLAAGYRAISVDFRSGSFVYDVTIKGPILGASFRF